MRRPTLQAAFHLCLCLGSPHPDYLLGADRLANFHARGLTHRQWKEWKTYIGIYPLPHDRADINAALIRASMSRGKRRVNAAKLIPAYGKLATVRSEPELKAIAMSMVKRPAGTEDECHPSHE